MSKTSITHRAVVPLQKKGGPGKSTVICSLAQYLTQRRVPWIGHDLDFDHKSFFRSFPSEVTLRDITATEPEAEVIKVIRTCTDTAVTLVDPRAHISDIILRGMEMVRFVQNFAEAGGRVTVPLIIADDLEVLTDIDGIVGRLGATVDYLIVRNPARHPKTRMFDGSALESDLVQLGAAPLEVPVLLSLARNHIAALEVKFERGITPVEVVANRELEMDGMIRLVVDDWIRTVFRRFDAVADKIMPTAYAEKIKGVDATAVIETRPVTRGAKLNLKNL